MSEDLLLKLYRCMLLSRRFDERMLNLQRQGRIGTFGPIQGQEAAQLGAAAVLEDKDWLVPSFREMAAEIWRGKKLVNVLLAYGGFNQGGALPEETTDLPVCIPVVRNADCKSMLDLAGEIKQLAERTRQGDLAPKDMAGGTGFTPIINYPQVAILGLGRAAVAWPSVRQSRKARRWVV